MRKLHLTAAFVGVLLFPLGGVSASAGSPIDAPQPTVGSAATPDHTASDKWPHNLLFACGGVEYTSMTEPAKDSTIVVRATAIGTPTIEHIARIPFTVQAVKVSQSFRGSRPGATLKVRQIGDDTVSVVGGAPLLDAGGEYILFLMTSGLKSKADQYSVTGGAGKFRFNSDGTADRLDPLSRKLPAKITVESIRQVVKSTRRI